MNIYIYFVVVCALLGVPLSQHNNNNNNNNNMHARLACGILTRNVQDPNVYNLD